MHEMQTIVIDDRVSVRRSVSLSVRQSVCYAAQLGFTVRGSFGTATV